MWAPVWPSHLAGRVGLILAATCCPATGAMEDPTEAEVWAGDRTPAGRE